MKRGSLRKPIPPDMRDELAQDQFMQRCIIGTDCNGRIEWNHAATYAGKRINELWSVLPMCTKHHREEARHRAIIKAKVKYRLAHFGIDPFVKYPKIIL